MEKPPELQSGWQTFALASAFFAAVTTILGKIGVSDLNSNLATFIRTVVIMVMTAGVVTLRHEWEPVTKLSKWGTTFLVLSGVATGLSWLFYYRALQMAPASRVAMIDKLSVALVVILAVLILGEPLNLKTCLGAVLIVAGGFVISLG